MVLFRYCVIVSVSLFLGACAVMDYQLEPRAGVINHQTDNARNNEILLNIVRASYSQPLNFVPISKTSGTQSTDLKVGLPTFTLGPAQTITQKQFAFAGNSWENSSNGSFDSVPLASHDFYANMMSPIALETANALIHMGYSRELVLNTMIASIRVEGGGDVREFRNDPFGEPGPDTCPETGEHYGPQPVGLLNASLYAPQRLNAITAKCEYHRFQFLMQAGMAWGLNVQVTSVPNPAYTSDAVKQAKAAGKDAPSKTISQAQLCFDPAFARDDQKSIVMTFPDRCGSTSLDKKGTTTNQQVLRVRFGSGPRVSPELTFTLKIRSTFSAFSYFGHMVRSYPTTPTRLYWPDRTVNSNDPWDLQVLTISKAPSVGCFASTYLNAEFFCVPSDAGETTEQVFSMLSQLVALSTTTGSLPSTLEVRLQ
ncbi:MAG: hypothetical protein JSV48_15155 [Bradyrhizobium sp.]|nr:MAG: hypothetical protein JSV48_15155 [Bradyrhizobium sp.]